MLQVTGSVTGPPIRLYGAFLAALERVGLRAWPGCRGVAGKCAGQATKATELLTGENCWLNPPASLPLGWDNAAHGLLEGEVHSQVPCQSPPGTHGGHVNLVFNVPSASLFPWLTFPPPSKGFLGSLPN